MATEQASIDEINLEEEIRNCEDELEYSEYLYGKLLLRLKSKSGNDELDRLSLTYPGLLPERPEDHLATIKSLRNKLCELNGLRATTFLLQKQE
jgi:hypothetical protein